MSKQKALSIHRRVQRPPSVSSAYAFVCPSVKVKVGEAGLEIRVDQRGALKMFAWPQPWVRAWEEQSCCPIATRMWLVRRSGRAIRVGGTVSEGLRGGALAGGAEHLDEDGAALLRRGDLAVNGDVCA